MEQMPPSEDARLFTEWGIGMIGHLKDAGIPIMAGTDTPIFMLTPGVSLHKELELLVEGGLTPLEALEAATARPAAYFGMEDELGQISSGMLADLVLLNASPLETITNTTQINAVMRNGHLYNRTALDQLLETAAN